MQPTWQTRATAACCSVTVIGTLLLIGACGSLGGNGSHGPGEDDGVSIDNGAVILSGSALTDGSGTILTAMTGKVPNFRVIRDVANQCPQITVRNNRVDYRGRVVNPHVYVDGTRATDTCILESLRPSDIERIEVYPQGFTNRPGYGRHAYGLILLFMRSG